MGLTVDDLLAVLRATVLHPVGSLVLLGASLVWDRMSGHLDAGGQTFGLLVKTALGCVAASWALHWNRSMSCRALNPAPRVPVSWPSEIVAVTGGSGGIGGELVRKLERLGATVAILDAVPPAFETGGWRVVAGEAASFSFNHVGRQNHALLREGRVIV